ncbi:MAG TPA: VWA domain-containing protein [Pyrinomonadaceae bacterium]|jgi:VWFA-related protein|nr:VWA domain-containing protein [Pyrinomonadaceae bacterium]
MPIRPLFALFLTAILASAGVMAQTPPGDKDEVLRVETQLVDVPVVVTDKAGKAVLGLKKNNFVVYEDGKPQDLEEFSTTSAPFEVALLLDTSGSTRSELQLIQRAAQNFISLLRPGDRVAIVSFNTFRDGDSASAGVQVLTPLTQDRAQLSAALEKVGTSNGTPYYDGLIEIAGKIFKNQPAAEYRGRRALVALTDGVDSVSASDFSEAQEMLSAEGIINFFIQVDTRPFFEENLLGNCLGAMRFSARQIRRYYAAFGSKANLERTEDFCKLGDFEKLAISKRLYEIADSEINTLAKSSGGKVFPAADLSEARLAFRTVADTIGTQYRLGYYSSNDKRDGTLRKIKVDVKGLPPGSVVRAREGYTAPTK